MKSIARLIIIVYLLAIILTPAIACDTDDDSSDSLANNTFANDTTITITDLLGGTITLDSTPERIVSLAPSNTEILFALGLEEKIVGVTENCDYPPEAEEITEIGGFKTVDMEKIIQLGPDLILAANMHRDTDALELKRRGFNVLIIAPETTDEVIENILILGNATGTEVEAESLANNLENRIRTITEKVSLLTDEEKPGVFYITWHDPLWTLGEGTITHELIGLAGGKNIVADIDGHGQTDIETVIWGNPQVILASTGHGSAEDSPVKWAQTEERLSHIDARLNDRVYQVNSDLVTRPGPRIVDGLETIAEFIHPELFSE